MANVTFTPNGVKTSNAANTVKILSPDTVKQGDTENGFRVQLLKDDVPVDLTGKTVTWSAASNKGKFVSDRSATVEGNGLSGTVGIEFTGDDHGATGSMRVEFKVAYADGDVEKFPAHSFAYFEITRSLDDMSTTPVMFASVQYFEDKVTLAQTSAVDAAASAEAAYNRAVAVEAQGEFAEAQGLFAQEKGAEAENQAAAARQVAVENKTRFLNPVSTVTLRNSTYPNPVHGDTVRVTSEAAAYRFQTGSGWVKTDEYNPTAIDNVTAQLAETMIHVESFTGTDTEKLQSAMNASVGKKLRLKDNKTYVIDSSITGVSNIEIIGNNSTIKVVDNVRLLNGLLVFESQSNIKITGVTFDMNMLNMPTYLASEYALDYNIGLNLKQINGLVEISGCKFINLYNIGLNVHNISSLLTIRDCIFTSLLQNQNQKASHIWLMTIGSFSKINIENCKFDNAPYTNADVGVNAIFMQGVKAKTTINNNYLNYVGRNNAGSHRLLPIDMYGDCQNITITNNKIDNAKYGFVRVHNCKDVIIENNRVHYTGDTLPEALLWIVNDASYTPDKKCENVKVSSNVFYAGDFNKIIAAISIYTYDWAQPLQNITIEKNSFHGHIITAVRMYFGFKNVTISENKCFHYDGKSPSDLCVLTRMTWNPSESTTTEANSISSELLIKNNQWQNENRAIYIEKGLYAGVVETVFIVGNNLKGIIGFNGIHVKDTEAFISSNMCNSYNSGIRVEGTMQATIIANVLKNTLYKIYKTDATKVTVANNYQDGVLIT